MVVPEKTDLSKKLCKAFQKLQMEDVSDTKAVKHLRKLHDDETTDPVEFVNNMTHILRLSVLRGSKERMNKYDAKIIEVVCRWATSFLTDEENKNKENKEANATAGGADDDDDEVIELPPSFRQLFDWLLDSHENGDSAARYKVCVMVNRLLHLLGQEASIDDELYQKIYDNMLERLKDKVADIRAQAVLALQRLQDPKDETCPIIRAFFFHMECDPSPLVRKSIVRCIGATKLTLSQVLKRTLDVDENVRKTAYKFVADKVHIKSLTIAQREDVVRRGLTDRSDTVRDVVAKYLVPAWLRFCNGNIVELLYALDVGNSNLSTAREVLTVLFNDVPYKELTSAFQYLDTNTKLVPKSKLTPETASYWNNLAKFLHNESEVKGVATASPFFEDFLPELSRFCGYVRSYLLDYKRKSKEILEQDSTQEDEDAHEMAWQFISRQLIDMIPLFDLGDVAGRNNLLKLCKELLLSPKIPIALVEPLMKIHKKAQTNPQQRIQDIAEIIAELREPMREAKKDEEEKEDGDEDDGDDFFMDSDTEDNDKIKDKKKSMDKGDVISKAERDKLEESQRAKKVEIAKVRVALNEFSEDLQIAIKSKLFQSYSL